MRKSCGSLPGGSFSCQRCRGDLARYAAKMPRPPSRSGLPYATRRPSASDAPPRSGETVARHRDKPTPCDATRCAARRAIHGRTHAVDRKEPEEWVSLLRSSLDRFPYIPFGIAKPVIGMLEKLLRDRQVDERRMDIAVTEI